MCLPLFNVVVFWCVLIWVVCSTWADTPLRVWGGTITEYGFCDCGRILRLRAEWKRGWFFVVRVGADLRVCLCLMWWFFWCVLIGVVCSTWADTPLRVWGGTITEYGFCDCVRNDGKRGWFYVVRVGADLCVCLCLMWWFFWCVLIWG